MLHTTRTLLSEIVDYAGLFPPAKLGMAVAVKNYAAYVACPQAWMLGRFIVPVARLEEFEREAVGLFPAPMAARAGGGIDGVDSESRRTGAGAGGNDEMPEPWRISALLGDDVDGDIERVFAFNQRHAPPETDIGGDEDDDERGEVAEADDDVGDDVAHGMGGGAVIDTIEFKASNGREIDRLMTIVPEQLGAYIEVPISQDPRGMVAAMAGTGARAKVRTGGIAAEAFPSAEDVARFIAACASAEVAFKATAGLHHPVGGEFNLTYEPGCARGAMYGFLNVFLAAALLKTGEGTEKDAVELLLERDPTALRFVEQGVAWREKRLATARLAMVRENFAMSFGSCSFEEPVAELKGMGLVD